MFESKTNHFCSIHEETSRSFLPVLPPIASNFKKLKRFCKQLILITEKNPQSVIYYRTVYSVVNERKKQVASGSWIIHPFSTIRIYYEMWMTVGFLLNFIIVPMNATFAYLTPGYSLIALDSFCDQIFWVNVIMNFRTGFVYSTEELLMNQSKIARAYTRSPYFFVDVLSSLPNLTEACESSVTCDVLRYLGLLKILRMPTFLQYFGNSLNYFRVGGFKSLLAKTLCVLVIACHYYSCFLFFSFLIYYSILEKTAAIDTTLIWTFQNKSDDIQIKEFYHRYLQHSYEVSSFLMGIEITYELTRSWFSILVEIIIMITGKILFTFLSVILVDIFKNTYYLDSKYHAMMSQVDSFMCVHRFPINLQKKIRQVYAHKYRGKYVNQPKIEKYLSEKLKKEIRYHDCRKLVQNVNIFEQFPQKILEDILNMLTLELYMANDYIVKAGTLGDCMYFISSGTVAVISPTGKEICHLADGDYFGEICLLVPKARRSASVIALEICEVYKMDRRLFKQCTDFRPTLLKEMQTVARQRFMETKDIESTFINLARSASI